MISSNEPSRSPLHTMRSITRSQWWLLLAAVSIAATCLASWAAWRDAVRHGRARTVGEALINAVQHGRPGSTPRARFHNDRARHELHMEFEKPPRREAQPPKSYGGLSLLRQVARLAGWSALDAEHDEDHSRLIVRAPLARNRGD